MLKMNQLIIFFYLFAAMLLTSAGALATPATDSGQGYINQCREAGVPIPPDWGDAAWEFVGVMDEDLTDGIPKLLSGPDTPALVYRFIEDDPVGACVAFPRLNNETDPALQRITLLGIICQGNATGKACFWDHEGQLMMDEEVPLTTFKGGTDLASQQACTDCHAGENAFIVHPGTPLDIGVFNDAADNIEDDILKPDRWYDPIVPASWVQNPGPSDQLLPPGCAGCHSETLRQRLPTLSNAYDVSDGDNREFCDAVLKPATGEIDNDRGTPILPTMPAGSTPGFMPGDMAMDPDVLAYTALCSQPPPFEVMYPTTANVERAGDRTAPGKIWVQVVPPMRNTYDIADYIVKIGGVEAEIISGLEVGRQFWMVVQHNVDPMTGGAVLSAGLHPLEVTVNIPNYGTPITTTNAASVRFDEEGVPVDVMVVGDVSGSMQNDGKFGAAQNAATLYLNHAGDGDRIGVVSFSNGPSLDIPLTLIGPSVTPDPRDTAKTVINNDWEALGSTALGGGINTAFAQFATPGDGTREFRMAVLTDGIENVAPFWADIAPTVTAENNLTIDAVALGPDAQIDLLRDIADSTGGTYFRVPLDGTATAQAKKLEPNLIAQTQKQAGFKPVSIISPQYATLPNRLADVYKTMAEDARKEQRIGDWDGSLYDEHDSDTFEITLESGLPEVIIAVHKDAAMRLSMNINGNTCSNSAPGADYAFDTRHIQCRIPLPPPGPMTITVFIPEVIITDNSLQSKPQFLPVQQVPSNSSVKYKLMVSAYTQTTVMEAPANDLLDGEEVPVIVFVGDDNPITGVIIWVQVTDEDGTIQNLTLYDDGQHGDGAAGDGFYGNYPGGLTGTGHTTTKIIATGTDTDGNPFKRTKTGTEFVPEDFDIPASIVATESLIVADRSKIMTNAAGEVYAGNYLELGADAEISGNTFVDGSAFMRSRAKVIGNLTLEQTLQTQTDTVITGTLTENAAVSAELVPAVTFNVGSIDIELGNDQTGTWQPGEFANGTVRARSTLTLKSGSYYFNSLIIEPNATVILDDSAGDIFIYTQNDFQFGNATQIFPGTTDNLTVYTNSFGVVNLGTDLNFSGNLLAPNAEVHIFSRTTAARVGARKIHLEPDVVLNPR